MKKNKKQKKNKNIIDMSYRRNIEIKPEKTYNDEDMRILIEELEKQMEQMKSLEEKYYSINVSIDRISERHFWDIVKEKINLVVNKRKIGKGHAFYREKSAKTVVRSLQRPNNYI